MKHWIGHRCVLRLKGLEDEQEAGVVGGNKRCEGGDLL